MSKDTQIPVGEFMQIRDAVADELKKGTAGNAQRQTLVRQAEELLVAGYVDIDAVRTAIAPTPTPTPTVADADVMDEDDR